MAPKSKSKISSDPVEDLASEFVTEESFRFPDSYRNEFEQDFQVLIPDDNSSSLCLLGPAFPLVLPTGLPEVYPVVERDPLLLQLPKLEWSGWGKNTCLRSWPYTVEMGWVDWVRRMTKFLFDDWKKMGVRETIELSQFPLEMNSELLAAAACFWSKSSNTLVLHCGLLSPTVLDVSHLTGLPSLGREVNALLSPDPYDPPFVVPSSGVSYSKWLKTYYSAKASGPFFHEKIAFYLFWICRFLIAVPGLRVTKEYLNLAVCMAQGRRLALAPFVLGSLYKGLFTFVDKKIADSCGGPFWLFQAWLYAYFPQLKPKLNNPLRSDEVLRTCRCYAEYFLGFLTQTEESSFQRYFTFFYEDNKGNWPVFYPFGNFEYSSERLRPCFEDIPSASPQLLEKMSHSKRLFWASILLPRLIPVGFALNNTPFGNCSFENYSPCQFARQFGLAQGIPMPFVHPEIAEMASSRPTIKAKDSQMITLMVNNFHHRVKAFKLIDFKITGGTLPAFDEWWSTMKALYFSAPLPDCLYRLDPEYKYLQDKAEETARLPDKSSKAVVPHAGAVVPISSVPSGNTRKRRAESNKNSETGHTSRVKSGQQKGILAIGGPKRAVDEVSTLKTQSTRKRAKKHCVTPKKGKGTKIVDAFEEAEEDANSSKSSQIQKSSFSVGETVDTELAIDQYQSFDTAISDPLDQVDWLPELQENLPCQENPLLLDDNSFLQVGDSMVLMSMGTEPGVHTPQQCFDSANQLEPNSNNAAPEVDTTVDPNFQRAHHIDLNQQGDSRETTASPRMIDAPNLETPLTQDVEVSEQMEPARSPVQSTQISPIKRGDQGAEDVASSPSDNQAAPSVDVRNLGFPIIPVLNTSPRSVNKAAAIPVGLESLAQEKSSSDSLDHLMEEIESTSQALRSLTEVPESSSSSLLQLGEEAQKEIQGFLGFLQLPFDELMTVKSTEFSACIESLSQRHVFPLREQIILENFASSLGDTTSLYRYYQKEIGQKQELIGNLSTVTAKLSTMHADASTLKSRLVAIDQEEKDLKHRLGQLKSERELLLATASQLDKDFKCLAEEGKGVSVHVSAAREDLQRNSLRCDELVIKWETFKSAFLHE